MALAVLGLCNAALLWQDSVPGMTEERAIRIVAPMMLDGVRGFANEFASEPAGPPIRERLSPRYNQYSR